MIENIKRKHTSRSVDVIGHNEKLTNSKEWKKNVFTNLISSCGSTSLSVTMRTLGSSLASSTSSSVSIISKPCRHKHKNENWKQNLESDLAEENKINSYIDMMCFLILQIRWIWSIFVLNQNTRACSGQQRTKHRSYWSPRQDDDHNGGTTLARFHLEHAHFWSRPRIPHTHFDNE